MARDDPEDVIEDAEIVDDEPDSEGRQSRRERRARRDRPAKASRPRPPGPGTVLRPTLIGVTLLLVAHLALPGGS